MKLTEIEAQKLADSLNYEFHGLVQAIVQDSTTNEVLMVAYMNKESVRRTLTTGRAHFWSRSRNRLWLKGETSGHFQDIKEILVDCDEDVLLLKVVQTGYPCHKGYASCFFREIKEDGMRTFLPCIGDEDKKEG